MHAAPEEKFYKVLAIASRIRDRKSYKSIQEPVRNWEKAVWWQKPEYNQSQTLMSWMSSRQHVVTVSIDGHEDYCKGQWSQQIENFRNREWFEHSLEYSKEKIQNLRITSVWRFWEIKKSEKNIKDLRIQGEVECMCLVPSIIFPVLIVKMSCNPQKFLTTNFLRSNLSCKKNSLQNVHLILIT